MVMPFVRKTATGRISVEPITEEQQQTNPNVSVSFSTEDLEGHDHTLSVKVEIGVLKPLCSRISLLEDACLPYISIERKKIHTITLLWKLNVHHVGGGQRSRGTKNNQ